MTTLDLHTIKHEDVKRLVEDFIFANEMPVKIITGNSLQMKQLVLNVIKEYNCYHMESVNLYNLGEIIVYD